MKINLFDEETGFRLKRLEIFNWGTFDRQVWKMTTDCQTAVLTGANGSGKSTVVDALLTLLVEGRQRNYNLAAGVGRGRERSERTYVRGQYSRSRGDNAFEATANTLRNTNSHSALLAVFYDAAQDRTVTLAQVLWISNADRVEKRYYVASRELTIEEHFPQRHVNARDLPEDVQTFGSTFKNYIAAARKVLGLSGRQKALDLFNETVAVKDIPSLNTFVRDHMLDKGNPEARVYALRAQYRELNDAHAAIQRAGRQLNILAPLVEAGAEYRRYEQQMARYEAAKSLIPFYVAGESRDLLNAAIEKVSSQLDARTSRRKTITTELSGLRRELDDIKIAIAQDSVGQMKREIEGRLPLLKGQVVVLRRAADKYDEHARRLELAIYRDEDAFYENRARAEQMQAVTQETIQHLEDQRTEAHFRQRELAQRENSFHQEVEYLRAHPSNIPASVARIREEISAALELPAEALSFVGELLKIRSEDAAWEGALERLLHGFALDLIVPETLYRQVSRYVNENRLHGRLVYHRVDPVRRLRVSPERKDHNAPGMMAYDKLQIKPDTPYHDWLAASLMQRFNYACCETLADFQQRDRGITRQGQIKHNRSRHEKDDRRDLQDRRYYVLGWDNRDKLRQLETELDDLRRELSRLKEVIQQIEQSLRRKREDEKALDDLLSIQAFDEIDWHTPQLEVDRLQRELDALNEQSQQLRRMEQQRDSLQRQIDEKEAARDAVNREITTLENQVEGYERQLKTAEAQLATMTDEHRRLWEQVDEVLEDIDKEQPPLTIEILHSRPNDLGTSLQNSMSTFKGYQTRHESTIRDAMHTFRREYPDEGAALTADMASLAAFEAIHERLATDDLPRYEERFKNLLDRKVSTSIMQFSAQLETQEREIERNIEELNDSLAKVDYGNRSTIRLIADRTTDGEIGDFRRTLRACIPDAGDDSPEELERSFNRIKALIERFNDDPNWMQRVIDVRRWRVFAAEQIDAEGRQIDYYSDSSGKSGGQKAKLAYTILASAIAYQYGLQDMLSEDRSFRLVVIDEAFSKLDDDNARFAMQLFNQLGLQLLVITPMQQLHIIEDFVNAYHVVVNNDEGSYSRLFNLTQSEYREHRREFQMQALQV